MFRRYKMPPKKPAVPDDEKALWQQFMKNVKLEKPDTIKKQEASEILEELSIKKEDLEELKNIGILEGVKQLEESKKKEISNAVEVVLMSFAEMVSATNYITDNCSFLEALTMEVKGYTKQKEFDKAKDFWNKRYKEVTTSVKNSYAQCREACRKLRSLFKTTSLPSYDDEPIDPTKKFWGEAWNEKINNERAAFIDEFCNKYIDSYYECLSKPSITRYEQAWNELEQAREESKAAKRQMTVKGTMLSADAVKEAIKWKEGDPLKKLARISVPTKETSAKKYDYIVTFNELKELDDKMTKMQKALGEFGDDWKGIHGKGSYDLAEGFSEGVAAYLRGDKDLKKFVDDEEQKEKITGIIDRAIDDIDKYMHDLNFKAHDQVSSHWAEGDFRNVMEFLKYGKTENGKNKAYAIKHIKRKTAFSKFLSYCKFTRPKTKSEGTE